MHLLFPWNLSLWRPGARLERDYRMHDAATLGRVIPRGELDSAPLSNNYDEEHLIVQSWI